MVQYPNWKEANKDFNSVLPKTNPAGGQVGFWYIDPVLNPGTPDYNSSPAL